MDINTAFNTSAQALQLGQQKLTETAENIAQSTVSERQAQADTAQADNAQTGKDNQANAQPKPDLTTELVDLLANQLYTSANTKSLSTSSDLMGKIINIKA